MNGADAGGLRERTADLGYAAGWRLVRTMPDPLAEGLFRRGADAASKRDGRGTRQLRRNLRRVVGPLTTDAELDQLVQAALRSYARYWKEAFRLPTMDKRLIAEEFELHGSDLLDASYAAGRGVILVLPHMANWDVAGVWLIAHGIPFATVVERLKPESLFDRFVAYRQDLGMEIVPLSGGARTASEVLAERLRAGGCICLLGDRDLSARGVEVNLFGEAARIPPGPAMLAAQTGAALHPAGLWNRGRYWSGRVRPAIELPDLGLAAKVRAGTQQVADGLAAEIAEHPADWHMLQRLWVADLAERAAAGR